MMNQGLTSKTDVKSILKTVEDIFEIVNNKLLEWNSSFLGLPYRVIMQVVSSSHHGVSLLLVSFKLWGLTCWLSNVFTVFSFGLCYFSGVLLSRCFCFLLVNCCLDVFFFSCLFLFGSSSLSTSLAKTKDSHLGKSQIFSNPKYCCLDEFVFLGFFYLGPCLSTSLAKITSRKITSIQ